MAHPAFDTFTRRMDRMVSAESDPGLIARTTATYLSSLLTRPDFLTDRFRQPSNDSYAQHIVRVHPEGWYSIVSLVWLPGQSTPVHDHVSWCVVGVLVGEEEETRYDLYEDGHEGDRFLVPRETTTYRPGEVCWLVPPEEDIHLVRNIGTSTGISIHIYGADISILGTSIHHVFHEPIRDYKSPGAIRARWRSRTLD